LARTPQPRRPRLSRQDRGSGYDRPGRPAAAIIEDPDIRNAPAPTIGLRGIRAFAALGLKDKYQAAGGARRRDRLLVLSLGAGLIYWNKKMPHSAFS
jgi:hypothetical protein